MREIMDMYMKGDINDEIDEEEKGFDNWDFIWKMYRGNESMLVSIWDPKFDCFRCQAQQIQKPSS